MFLPVTIFSVADVFFRDPLVIRDLTAHKEKKASEDPGVRQVLLDHLDLLERE